MRERERDALWVVVFPEVIIQTAEAAEITAERQGDRYLRHRKKSTVVHYSGSLGNSVSKQSKRWAPGGGTENPS